MPFAAASSLARLIAAPVRPGTVEWIGLRPARRAAIVAVPAAELVAGRAWSATATRTPAAPAR